ncbi:hypothetical protein J6590_082614 [Homalodisca vitripennis]|nr:hypothetical protein J6590_082614 [Homalodisca vitripennis]
MRFTFASVTSLQRDSQLVVNSQVTSLGVLVDRCLDLEMALISEYLSGLSFYSLPRDLGYYFTELSLL